jgi:putative ABC transport system permease protein
VTARHRPPAWATAVVRLGIPTRERETALAELDELYACHVERDGKRRALCWYLGQGFSFFTMGLRARASDDALETVTGSARAARMAWSAEVMQDIRFAARGFLKAPGFAAIAVCTIAIGFGLNSSVFSVVNGVVLRPLPYQEADRLVRLWPEWALTMEQFDRISDRTESLVELSAFGTEWYTVVGAGSAGGEGSGVATGLSVTPNHFTFFGVQPIMGRPMLASDARPTAQNTVWLGHALWRSQFGGDSSIVGRSIDVLLFTTLPMAPGAFAGERYQVAGVMPEGFEPLGEPVDLWLPLIRVPGSGIYADFGDLEVLGRLEPGVTVAALAPTLTAILEQEFPDGVTH